ncbi:MULTISPECIES: hypothetical protein [Corynebacterium]|uniref:hypothetical protein n=1 Tax=Corynebacterium TaxID=1716 RepID=UPI0021A916A9|nr:MULTISPECIES: hypothetical protein [Bacteria]MCT2338043.1 hypothetical protein [Corynebacterium sp. p3-SID1056]MDK8314201.1 hypothetical protein [Klebsiella aerogenes]MDK8638591.1 hypothetical protein [Corynebacterium imitans]MDK8773798.1 hypothetical protein [Corynebacterium imitans]
MQLELQRTNDAELTARKRSLLSKLEALLGENDVAPENLQFLADSGSLTLQERAIYDELRRVKILLQED